MGDGARSVRGGSRPGFPPLSLSFLESPLTTAKIDRMIRRIHTSCAISSLFLGGGGGGGMSQLFVALVVSS